MDKVLTFIQQFDAAFGDEGFTESSKLHHVAMHFQKSAKQWWASLQANGEAPKTWKALRASIMKQFLASNAKDKVLTEWRSLKHTPYESIHRYVDKFWDLHLKATVYKKIDFEEQKQQFCAGLPEDINEYVNPQRSKSISVVIYHNMVAARINFQQRAKRNLKPMEAKDKQEYKGKNFFQNSSKGNSNNNKAKERESSKVHLTNHMYKQKLLEASPLFYGKQMVHVLPWSPSKDYQNLIRHSCPVWVEVVNFPDYMREELLGLAASLGRVICPPRPTGNRNRFCILWDIDKPTPPSIAIEVEDVIMGETYFDLKWGVFAGACFTCHKFGHLASECPQVVHKPPPNAIPQSDIVSVCLLTEKTKPSRSVVSDANLKSAPQLVAQSSKAKDKGKALMADAKKSDLNGWQQPKKVFSSKTKPLQSRNWSASPATRLWTDVLRKGLPMLDVDDMDVLHVHAQPDEHEDMAVA
ncbi:hypothetical protein L7F22_030365 [Adiantum nelumboides]|nr:hypothetical protein [Adiantum nelumboides]